MAADDSVKIAYAKWLNMTDAQRRQAGLPSSQAKFAAMYDLAPRTLTRWKDDPVVITTLTQLRAGQAAPQGEGPPVAPLEGMATLQQDLLAKAMKGDDKALDLYMKYWGKEALEEDRRAREHALATMTDEELAHSVLEMLGPEVVGKWLEAQRVGA